MKNYTIDHATATIICTKKFYENASRFSSPECKQLQKMIATFPKYSVKVRTIKTKETKRTANKNLTFDNMVRYIASQPNARENLVEFAKIRNLSGQKGNSTFHAVKTWFLGKYPDFNRPGVSEQERQNVERFITADAARELLAAFAACTTMADMQSVVSRIFDSMEKGESSESTRSVQDTEKKAHPENALEFLDKAS